MGSPLTDNTSMDGVTTSKNRGVTKTIIPIAIRIQPNRNFSLFLLLLV